MVSLIKKRLLALTLALLILLVGCGSAAYGPMRGTWSGNIYTNEYVGITFTLPDTWIAATDAEIAMLLNVSMDALPVPGAAIPDGAWDELHFYDMLAQSHYTGSSIIIMYERLTNEEASLSEREYLELMREVMEEEMPEYSTFIIADSTTRIGSDDWYLLTVEYQHGVWQHYFINERGGYIRGILVTIYGQDSMEDILEMFS